MEKLSGFPDNWRKVMGPKMRIGAFSSYKLAEAFLARDASARGKEFLIEKEDGYYILYQEINPKITTSVSNSTKRSRFEMLEI